MTATVATNPALGFADDAVQGYLVQVLASLGGLTGGRRGSGGCRGAD